MGVGTAADTVDEVGEGNSVGTGISVGEDGTIWFEPSPDEGGSRSGPLTGEPANTEEDGTGSGSLTGGPACMLSEAMEAGRAMALWITFSM